MRENGRTSCSMVYGSREHQGPRGDRLSLRVIRSTIDLCARNPAVRYHDLCNSWLLAASSQLPADRKV